MNIGKSGSDGDIVHSRRELGALLVKLVSGQKSIPTGMVTIALRFSVTYCNYSYLNFWCEIYYTTLLTILLPLVVFVM